jgi:hypothetical protein
MEKIGDRLKQLIAVKTDDRLRYVQLESKTGVSADLWKNFWFGRKKADADMIEAASKVWPEHALWLASGITDVQYGHIAGTPEATFPETHPQQSMPASSEYFRASVKAREAANACVDALNADATIDKPYAIGSMWRTAISTWPEGKKIPALADELRDRMNELHDRLNARKPEVGLDSVLEAIVNNIKYDYNEKKLLDQVDEYKRRRIEWVKQNLI